MGRQTKIVATEIDEQSFLAFLRNTAEVQILVPSASGPDQLWVNEFAPFDRFHKQYYIWNKAFPWVPSIRMGGDNSFVWIQDTSTAPIIEFIRTDIEWLFRPSNKLLVANSRLYWCKHHMAPELSYDVGQFSRWYDRAIRWVRRNGRREPTFAGSPFVLPDAWRRWQEIRCKT